MIGRAVTAAPDPAAAAAAISDDVRVALRTRDGLTAARRRGLDLAGPRHDNRCCIYFRGFAPPSGMWRVFDVAAAHAHPGPAARRAGESGRSAPERAEVKEQLKCGSLTLEQLFEKGDHDEMLGKLKVVSMLESLPGVGKVRARATDGRARHQREPAAPRPG